MALDEKTFFYLIVAADASVLKAAFMSGANETGTGRRGTAGGQSDTCHSAGTAVHNSLGGIEGGRGEGGLSDSTSSATATASQQASSTGSISLPSSSSLPASMPFVLPGQLTRCVSKWIEVCWFLLAGTIRVHLFSVQLIEG